MNFSNADFALLQSNFIELRKEFDGYKQSVQENNDSFFKCSMAIVIFFMQCGFAFLEAGCIRAKNVTNLLLNNVLESLIAGIGYWAIGWAFAYGPNYGPSAPFIGGSQFFLIGSENYSTFFFQYVFAATASTIITGAVAERIEFFAFCCYSFVISSIIYPVLTHWGWSDVGWMKVGIQNGGIHVSYMDFAGSGMVHLCGGSIAFIAAWIIGPRVGRFPKNGEGVPNPINGHSVPLTALGGFILMFGFLAFNGGSTAEISTPGTGQITAKAMVNTILSGAFATFSYLLLYYLRKRKWSCLYGINAALAGMVAACAGCNISQPWGTTVIGIGAGLLYMAFSSLALKLKIDDPLDAFAVHFGGGLWGLIAVCLIGEKGIFYAIFYHDVLFTQALAQLGWNLLCALVIICWSVAATFPMFFLLKVFKLLRISPEVEVKGMDVHINGEPAYPSDTYGDGYGLESNKIFVKPQENGHCNGSIHQSSSSIRPIYTTENAVRQTLFLPITAFGENQTIINGISEDVRYRRHHSITCPS